jgi:signal transduction histidine kinase
VKGRPSPVEAAASAYAARVGSIWRRPHGLLNGAVSRLGETLSSPHEAPAEAPPWPVLAARAPQTVVILDRDRRILDSGDGVDAVLGRSAADLIGRRMELIPSIGGRGLLEVSWPDGSSHRLEFSATPHRRDAGQLVALRSVRDGDAPEALPAARDPKHALMADLRAPGRELRALIDAVGGRLAAALGADRVGVFESQATRQRLLLRAGAGWARGAVGSATVSGAAGAPVGRALAAGEPVIVGDLRRLSGAAPSSALLGEHGVVSGVEVPIQPQSGPWGVLGAYSTRLRRFSPDEVDFLCAVADTLALAIEREQAQDEIEERTRAQIAQRLHDEALQSMLAARQYLADGRHGADTRAHDAVRRAIGELRQAVSDLHPVAGDGAQLRGAIEAIVAHQSRRGGFAATVDIDLEPDHGCAPLLLSVARELTANVAQHAQARHARVELRRAGDRLVLEVSDDGAGIGPARLEEARAEGHIGLASVARRVDALGGELTIDSVPGQGTRVRIEIPGRGRPIPAGGAAGTGTQ